jgi:hypothetical protein
MAVKEKPTRAEQIRRERDSRPRRRSSKPSRRSQIGANGSLPPILVRGGRAAPASRSRRKGKSTRRRYDIALNNQGAEMRLPSIPTIRFGWRLLSGLLVVVLGFIVYMLWYSPIFTVSDLEVSGLVRLTDGEINSIADVLGKSIVQISPANLEQDLYAAFPELVNVSVKTEIPNKVAVNLVERKPVLTWLEDGQTFWVDADGVVFKPREESGPGVTVHGSELLSAAVPESEDIEVEEQSKPTIPVELVNAILIFSKEAPENTPLVYDKEHGLGWQDPRGWQVYFGNIEDQIEMKLRVYEKTWRRLKKAGIQPALISVEHVHAPIYRLER